MLQDVGSADKGSSRGWRLGFSLGCMDLWRFWFSGFAFPLPKFGPDSRQLGMWGIFVPISAVSLDFSVLGTRDDRALDDFEHSFECKLVLMDSSSERSISLEAYADKAMETSLKGSPKSP